MPIDPRIAMGVQSPQFEPRTNALMRMLQLENAQRQSELGGMQLQEQRAAMGERNALRDYMGANPNLDTPEGQAGLYKAAPMQAGKLIGDRLEIKSKQGNIKKTEIETVGLQEKQRRDNAAEHLNEVVGVADMQTLQAWMQKGIQRGTAKPEDVQATLAQAQQNPAQFGQWLDNFKKTQALAGLTQVQRYEQEWKAKTDTRENAKFSEIQTHNRATEKTAQGQLSVSRSNSAETKRHHGAIEGAGDQGAGSGGLSPEAIANAAGRYNMDGTLPPMGMGKTGAAGRQAILNEAATQAAASGDGPAAQRIRQIANKAGAGALAQLEKQSSMVGAFEKNFIKNADIALELSAKVDRTGAPIINKWIQAGKRSVQGDPELAAFDASIKAVSNEYAKIVSGSMGNTALAEGEIKKIEGLLNAAQNKKQVEEVLALMKRETANRMTGFEDEKAEIRARMAPKTRSTDTPSATPAAGGATGDFGKDPLGLRKK